jgi:hypothetical protein
VTQFKTNTTQKQQLNEIISLLETQNNLLAQLLARETPSSTPAPEISLRVDKSGDVDLGIDQE